VNYPGATYKLHYLPATDQLTDDDFQPALPSDFSRAFPSPAVVFGLVGAWTHGNTPHMVSNGTSQAHRSKQ
jgi:hypothetical protein